MHIGKLYRLAGAVAWAAVTFASLEPLAAAATNTEGSLQYDAPPGASTGLLVFVLFLLLGVTGVLLFFIPPSVAARLARPLPLPPFASGDGARDHH